MKQLVLSTLLMAISSFASAYDAQINGVCYNLVPKGNVAEVTSGGFYSNAVNIPEKFTYNGVDEHWKPCFPKLYQPYFGNYPQFCDDNWRVRFLWLQWPYLDKHS